MQAGFVASIHLCGASDFEIVAGVLLFFPQGKWELLQPKQNSLASDSLRLVPAGNERASSITT